MKVLNFCSIIFILFLLSSFITRDGDVTATINIEYQHKGNHFGLPIYPADQPEVYYDDVEQEIIIDGQWSEASYYDVDIVSLSTLDTALSTRVSSTFDTIDVSSLPDDNYKIVITSYNENTYYGYFTKVPGKNR